MSILGYGQKGGREEGTMTISGNRYKVTAYNDGLPVVVVSGHGFRKSWRGSSIRDGSPAENREYIRGIVTRDLAAQN